ncbi:restriction endonuclease subunit S [Micromonospora sp. CPCC 205561]|uniref:restriction endonuclease subunit S n=1 Tax=Micromonospora sp. CPCC 205561 TaxID=3122407 RepID=UPI002FEEE3D4
MTVLFTVPHTWVWAEFGDVARVAANLVDPAGFLDAPHIAPNHIETGTGRLLSYRTIREDGVTSPKHRFFPGQLIYSKIRPYLAKVIQSPIEGLCSADMYPIEPYIEHRYLLYWMLSPSFTAQTSAHQTRTILPKINEQELSRIAVPVPPLAEQRRIVAVLDDLLSRWDVGSIGLATIARRVDRFRDQVMFLAGTGQLVSTNLVETASPPRAASVVDGELPGIPVTWQWKRLEEIADVVGGVTKDAKKQADPDYVEVPYLRVANVQRARLDLSEVTRMRVPAKKAAQLRLLRGDVLLNEGGDRDKLGRGWVWDEQIPDCIHQNHVFRARVRDGVLHPKLLAWHANGFGRRWFQVNGLQSVNLASISLGKMRQFPVPVPPRAEQETLVRTAETYLSLLDGMDRAVGAAGQKAVQLRASLLAEAFAGRLVPQDPNDEVASELLTRIRAEREATLPKRKMRTRRTPEKLTAPPTRVTDDNYQQEALPL